MAVTLPTRDPRGNALIALDRTLAESDLPSPTDAAIPCPLSLVVVSRAGSVLFGWNRWRAEWELPGGMRDADESARTAASRELREETGILASPEDLDYVGAARFSLTNPDRDEWAAVYTIDDPAQRSTFTDGELTSLRWWDGASTPADMNPLDAAISRWAAESR